MITPVTPDENKTKWVGETPKECQLCHKPLPAVFVDGTIWGTLSWAIQCPKCHAVHGDGFGLGKGQMYETKTGNKILG